MGARPTWKGVLQIQCVAVPIKVYPATEASAALSFHQLHSPCQTRIQQKKWCPTCAREITSAELVKGFEFEPGKFVLLLAEELDAVHPPSTRVIALTQFAEAGELEPYAIDRSYYLAPDGPRAAEAFSVLRIAMRHRVGIGKLAIYGREYLIAVRPAQVPASATSQSVLMLHTLHHAAELRSVEAIDELQTLTAAPIGQVRLAQQLIAALCGPLDLADFTDAYQADLQRLIDAKIAGEEVVEPPIAETVQVLNLEQALTQSLRALKPSPSKGAKVRV
jgi:DNA end-binding protein Ku